jgi:iron complex transport system ATP-binding protein
MVVAAQDISARRTEEVLSASGLAFAYDGQPVLSDVELTLKPGDMLGVIGPNGSGKSTLLGMLCGLLPPNTGDVMLHGKPIDQYKRDEVARLLGVVPQAAELAPGFSVLETALAGRFAVMGGRVFENDDDLAAAKRALEQTGIWELRQRRAGELSGGECQRLALARALSARPGILLLDEPTSALDLEHQLRVMSMLERACRDDGLAVCLVSHDLNLASLYCNSLLLLAQGKPLAMGAPAQVLTPQLLSQAYNVQVAVDSEPSRGRPRVTLLASPL